MNTNEQVSKHFETGFLSQALSLEVVDCDKYELAPLFLKIFRENQPVLEAGCGNGKWCVWLKKNNIHCDGIDWSKELCARASMEFPQLRFIACDMQNTQLSEKSYGAIMALGSIEHNVAGPMAALKEFHRLLRQDGVAVITVPYGGRLRLLMRSASKPLLVLKSFSWVRQLFGKPVAQAGTSILYARKLANRRWHPRYAYGPGGWYFYEYEFNKLQMREFLTKSDFFIREEFVSFGDQGILLTFGRLAGKYNSERKRVDFTVLGKILRILFKEEVVGQMLCYIIGKKTI